jgi:hypothetical protein
VDQGLTDLLPAFGKFRFIYEIGLGRIFEEHFMSNGNQGPEWWFAWVGATNTNLGMARFLALPLVFIAIFGTILWLVLPAT